MAQRLPVPLVLQRRVAARAGRLETLTITTAPRPLLLSDAESQTVSLHCPTRFSTLLGPIEHLMLTRYTPAHNLHVPS